MRSEVNRVFLVCIALCLAVLVFDANTPLGYAEWVLYLLPISVAFWRLRQRQLAYVASLSILLLGLGFVVSPPGSIPWQVGLFNRAAGAIIISLTAFAFVQFKRMNEMQRESEEKYRALAENSPNFIGILQDGVLKYVNRTAVKRFGWTYDELVSRSFSPVERMVAERFRGVIKKDISRMLRGEDTPPYEISITTRDGSEIPVIVRAARITYQGRPAVEFTMGDITERKQMESELSRSNQFFRSVIENAYVWLNVLDNEQNVIIWNKAAEAISGYSREEVAEHGKIWEWLYPDQEYRKQITATVTDVLRSGRTDVDTETKIRRKDGQTRIISWNERALIDQDGKTIGTIAIGRDVTEQRRMEEALLENEARFRRIFEEGPLGMALLSPDYHFVRVNKTLCRMLGYSQHELTGLKFTDITHPEDMREGVELTEKMRRGEIPRFSIEKRYIKKNGDVLPANLTASYIRDAKGNPVYSLAIIEDITRRKALEEQLKQYSESLEQLVLERTGKLAESERRFRELADLLPQIVFEINEQGNLLFANRITFATTGYTEDDLRRGLNAFQMFVPEDHDRARHRMQRILSGEKLGGDEYTLQRKDGSTFPAIVNAAPIMRGNKPVGLRGIVIDITERKRMEQKLQDSEERFRGIAERSTDEIFEADHEGRITYVSPAAERIFGHRPEEAIGTSFSRSLLESDRQKAVSALARVAKGEIVERLQLTVPKKDGALVIVEVSCAPIFKAGQEVGIQGIVRDITERVEMEERLRQAECLAAIGETAAMVGHDLRNPLQGIAGAIHILRQESLKVHERDEMLQLIERNIEYSDAIVRDLSDYSAQIHLELAETTPKSLTIEAIQAVKAPAKVTIQNHSQDQPTLRVDAGRVKRVLINLIENAFEAMPEGGTVTITSRQWNNAAEIAISDTGAGMPAKIMENLWKPLQTTKAKGMGLGLAICKRIVDAHGGDISVKSEVGEGTTVTIRLPLQPIIAEVKQK